MIKAEGQNALDAIKVLSRSSKSETEPVIFWQCGPQGRMLVIMSVK